MEKIDLRVQSSMVKFTGTIVCITGALTVTLYKGLPLTNGSPSMPLELLLQPQSRWILGGFLLACGAFLLSVLLVVQVCRSKRVNYLIILVFLLNEYDKVHVYQHHQNNIDVTMIKCEWCGWKLGPMNLMGSELFPKSWLKHPWDIVQVQGQSM